MQKNPYLMKHFCSVLREVLIGQSYVMRCLNIFIVIGSKGKLEYLPPALVTLKSMGLGNFHAIIFEELPEGF